MDRSFRHLAVSLGDWSGRALYRASDESPAGRVGREAHAIGKMGRGSGLVKAGRAAIRPPRQG